MVAVRAEVWGRGLLGMLVQVGGDSGEGKGVPIDSRERKGTGLGQFRYRQLNPGSHTQWANSLHP